MTVKALEDENRGPYCPPLGIYFPLVWRVTQSMSRADLDKLGEDEAEPFRDHVYYTLDAADIARRFPGEVTAEPLQHGPPDPDELTWVVRYHPDQAHADGYWAAKEDLFDTPSYEDDDEPTEPAPFTPIGEGDMRATRDGLFSLTPRPRHLRDASQPGPLLIYMANVPMVDRHGKRYQGHWYLALAADGAEVKLGSFDIPE